MLLQQSLGTLCQTVCHRLQSKLNSLGMSYHNDSVANNSTCKLKILQGAIWVLYFFENHEQVGELQTRTYTIVLSRRGISVALFHMILVSPRKGSVTIPVSAVLGWWWGSFFTWKLLYVNTLIPEKKMMAFILGGYCSTLYELQTLGRKNIRPGSGLLVARSHVAIHVFKVESRYWTKYFCLECKDTD